jgi:hypothetical protein
LDTLQPTAPLDHDELEFDDAPDSARAVLEVRLGYFYELRIPFADGLVFGAWYAMHAMGNGSLSAGEWQTMSALARGALGDRRFFIPLWASAAHRMQSSFHRKWLQGSEP